MDNSIMSLFVTAAKDVFSEIGFLDLSVTDSTFAAEHAEIVSSLGIVGDLQGYFVLRGDRESVYNFVSKILSNMGMDSEGEEFGQFHKEAVGEIVNQVSGRAVMMLAEQGYDCNITPPTILMGNNIQIDMKTLETHVTRDIRGPYGTIGIFAGIKKMK
ncbi:MAG TPA: chemotaxis protein CheX [Spirochaetia bacterium]|nr:chemotaxis protein CheX [Spirochaetia bacterium]